MQAGFEDAQDVAVAQRVPGVDDGVLAKKYILDLTVTENVRLHANYALLKLTSPSLLPEMLPGQLDRKSVV